MNPTASRAAAHALNRYSFGETVTLAKELNNMRLIHRRIPCPNLAALCKKKLVETDVGGREDFKTALNLLNSYAHFKVDEQLPQVQTTISNLKRKIPAASPSDRALVLLALSQFTSDTGGLHGQALDDALREMSPTDLIIATRKYLETSSAKNARTVSDTFSALSLAIIAKMNAFSAERLCTLFTMINKKDVNLPMKKKVYAAIYERSKHVLTEISTTSMAEMSRVFQMLGYDVAPLLTELADRTANDASASELEMRDVLSQLGNYKKNWDTRVVEAHLERCIAGSRTANLQILEMTLRVLGQRKFYSEPLLRNVLQRCAELESEWTPNTVGCALNFMRRLDTKKAALVERLLKCAETWENDSDFTPFVLTTILQALPYFGAENTDLAKKLLRLAASEEFHNIVQCFDLGSVVLSVSQIPGGGKVIESYATMIAGDVHKLAANEIVSVVSGLANAFKEVGPKSVLFTDLMPKVLGMIAKSEVILKDEKFSTVLLVHALAKCRTKHMQILDQLATALASPASVTARPMSPAQIVKLLTALAQLQYKNTNVFDALATKLVAQQLQEPELICSLMYAFALAGIKNYRVINECAPRIRFLLHGCTPLDLVRLTYSFSRLKLSEHAALLKATCERMAQIADKFTPKESISILVSLKALDFTHKPLLEAFGAALDEKAVESLDFELLIQYLGSLAVLHPEVIRRAHISVLLQRLSRAGALQQVTASPSTLPMLLTVLGRQKDDVRKDESTQAIAATLSEAVESMAPTMNEKAAVDCVWGLAMLGHKPPNNAAITTRLKVLSTKLTDDTRGRELLREAGMLTLVMMESDTQLKRSAPGRK